MSNIQFPLLVGGYVRNGNCNRTQNAHRLHGRSGVQISNQCPHRKAITQSIWEHPLFSKSIAAPAVSTYTELHAIENGDQFLTQGFESSLHPPRPRHHWYSRLEHAAPPLRRDCSGEILRNLHRMHIPRLPADRLQIACYHFFRVSQICDTLAKSWGMKSTWISSKFGSNACIIRTNEISEFFWYD